VGSRQTEHQDRNLDADAGDLQKKLGFSAMFLNFGEKMALFSSKPMLHTIIFWGIN
jgi:hypothetical protein